MAATAQRPLTSAQLGIQSAEKIAVAATTIMAGLGVARHRLRVVPEIPQELTGLLTYRRRSVVVGLMGEIHLEGWPCFDDLCYLLAMALRSGQAAGASDGGTPAAYDRSYVPSLTGVDQPDFYTMEMGNNIQYWQYNGVMATSLNISGAVGQLSKFTADLNSVTRVAQAKTGSLSERTPVYMPANNFTISIDDTGGTVGTTLFAGCPINFNWQISAFDPFKCIDGTQVRSYTTEHPIDCQLQFSAALDSTLVALLDSEYKNQTRVLTRLECIDDNAAIHGTVHKRLRLDQALVLSDVAQIGAADQNGTELVSLTFQSLYDSGASLLAKAAVRNAVATLA